MFKRASTAVIGALSFASLANAETSNHDVAGRIFARLSGHELAIDDPRWPQFEQAVAEGRFKDVATAATAEPSFYNVTAVNFAALMSSKDEGSFTDFNDLQALIVGAIRDQLDARTLLTGDFRYSGKTGLPIPPFAPDSNSHYAETGRLQLPLVDSLLRVAPQGTYEGETAGALTSRAWGEAFYAAGTNRRSVNYAFREFLCTPITQWRDPGLSEQRIRRDVDRAPGGDFNTFQTVCRSCHAPMDAMAGAFAKIDFVDGRLKYYQTGVAPKYNQNIGVFPDGYLTADDSWFNQAIYHQNVTFGWRGPLSGNGIRQFGQMLADSQQFKQCMVKRVVREVCRKDLSDLGRDVTDALADGFEAQSYNLKSLFEDVASNPACLDAAALPVLKNHRQMYYSFAAATKVDPTDAAIRQLFSEDRTLLPELGNEQEIGSPALFASASIASYFCRRMISKDALIVDRSQRTADRDVDFTKGPSDLTEAKVASVSQEYARLFLKRDATGPEIDVLKRLVSAAASGRPDTPAETKNILTLTCAAVGGSFDSLTF